MKSLVTLSCFIVLVVASTARAEGLHSFFNADFYQKLRQSYGAPAERRAKEWQKLILKAQSDSEWNKANKINDFFNENIQHQNDMPLWGEKDYWASPVETIGRGLGDCEDYAIAKFFSLRALGISENKLRLMYVRQLMSNSPHMVLIYFEEPKAIPLVLDNFNPKILPANKRPDLKPIYSFNGEGLWMAEATGAGRKIENSGGVSAWDQLLQRIENGSLPQLGIDPTL